MDGRGIIARTVYRSLLRASRRGRAPEVFGKFGATLVPRSEEPAMPPMDAGAVRRLLKDGFVGGGTEDSEAKMNETMFAALRRANDLSSVIFPGVDAKNFPSSLPIFDFSGSNKLKQVLRLRDIDWSHVHITRRAITFDGDTYNLKSNLTILLKQYLELHNQIIYSMLIVRILLYNQRILLYNQLKFLKLFMVNHIVIYYLRHY